MISVDDITNINGQLLIEHESIFMKNLKTYCAQLITILCLAPFAANADVGIVAIAVDANLQDKGAFETNAGINEGDIISTGQKGSLTILFDDESMLTLGPNTKAKIVKYSETPAPGVSEIKIISGSFNYFPGTILENGGQQLLTNLVDINKNESKQTQHESFESPQQSAQTNVQLKVTPQVNNSSDNGLKTGGVGSTTLLNNINTADLGVTTTISKPIINLVVASSGVTDGSNGGNTSVSGVEQDIAPMAAPELTFTIDPAFHFDMNGMNLHRKDSADNGHVPHS